MIRIPLFSILHRNTLSALLILHILHLNILISSSITLSKVILLVLLISEVTKTILLVLLTPISKFAFDVCIFELMLTALCLAITGASVKKGKTVTSL